MNSASPARATARPARLHTTGTDRRPRGSRAGRRRRLHRRLAGLLRFTVFLLLIFIAVWAGVRVAHASVDAGVYSGHEYVVQAGDTLWGIAAHEYGETMDLRQVVWQIRQTNHLQSAAVWPGQRVTLPYLGE